MLRPILIPLALMTSTAPATAAEPVQPPSMRVSYADLNIATPEGREALEKRVNLAIRQVCGGFVPASDLQKWAQFRQCQKVARQSTGVQIAVAVAKRGEAQQLALRGR